MKKKHKPEWDTLVLVNEKEYRKSEDLGFWGYIVASVGVLMVAAAEIKRLDYFGLSIKECDEAMECMKKIQKTVQ